MLGRCVSGVLRRAGAPAELGCLQAGDTTSSFTFFSSEPSVPTEDADAVIIGAGIIG